MKRILTSFALLTMVLAPAASFAQDRDDAGYREQTYVQAQPDYRQYQAPYRYDRRDAYDGYQQNNYAAPQVYGYVDNPNAYAYEGREDRAERSAEYVGGGAVAGAVLGAIVGHGTGAAVGAILGGLGGYVYQHNNDRRYDRGY